MAQFKNDLLKIKEDTTLQSHAVIQVYESHHRNVCKILRLYEAISLLFSDKPLKSFAF